MGQLYREMSSGEFELWMGLQLLRGDECPSCGIEPIEMDLYELRKVKCPVCGHESERPRPYDLARNMRELRTVKVE